MRFEGFFKKRATSPTETSPKDTLEAIKATALIGGLAAGAIMAGDHIHKENEPLNQDAAASAQQPAEHHNPTVGMTSESAPAPITVNLGTEKVRIDLGTEKVAIPNPEG